MAAFLAASATHAATGGPVETAVNFLEASKAWRCDEVWRLYSAGTRENFLAVEHRYERERDGPPRPDPPEKAYCAFTHYTFERGSARLVRQDGDTALVKADFRAKISRSRWDLFTPTTIVTEDLQLVREGGVWRIERPRLPVGRQGWRLIEIGPVDVFQEKASIPGLLRSMEATTVSRLARKTLDAAFRDPMLWARVLPSVATVEPMEPAGESERVRLTFGPEPRHSFTVEVRHSDTMADPTSAATAVYWIVEGNNRAPVYFRGWWRVQPHHDGTRVTMTFYFDPKDWPGEETDEVFSAERIAQAVLDLDNAAREPVR
ncbi:MAG: SRPBCC family protein [Deltaproteobacteria bacterium]|nr:SRPBCC family protein [Deltaproteobacteria bacterium]